MRFPNRCWNKYLNPNVVYYAFAVCLISISLLSWACVCIMWIAGETTKPSAGASSSKVECSCARIFQSVTAITNAAYWLHLTLESYHRPARRRLGATLRMRGVVSARFLGASHIQGRVVSVRFSNMIFGYELASKRCMTFVCCLLGLYFMLSWKRVCIISVAGGSLEIDRVRACFMVCVRVCVCCRRSSTWDKDEKSSSSGW